MEEEIEDGKQTDLRLSQRLVQLRGRWIDKDKFVGFENSTGRQQYIYIMAALLRSNWDYGEFFYIFVVK